MKKLFFLIAFAFSLSASAQKFAVANAEAVSSSFKVFSRIVGDSAVIDSVSMTINCWFYQVGNPYFVKGQPGWTQFVQINATLKGNARASNFINGAWKFAEAYRQRHYPDIK